MMFSQFPTVWLWYRDNVCDCYWFKAVRDPTDHWHMCPSYCSALFSFSYNVITHLRESLMYLFCHAAKVCFSFCTNTRNLVGHTRSV